VHAIMNKIHASCLIKQISKWSAKLEAQRMYTLNHYTTITLAMI